jgi:alpha-glucosidase
MKRTGWMALLALLPAFSLRAQTSIQSPDSRITLTFTRSNQQLLYGITFNGKPVIAPSALALEIDGAPARGVEATGKPVLAKVNETYNWRGVHSKAVNNYQQAILPVTGAGNIPIFRIEARVFNNGVAFRYLLDAAGKNTIDADNTIFSIPAGSTIWSQGDIGGYEGKYRQQDIATIKAGQKAGPPLTIQLPEGAGYAAITEGGLTDFAGMSLVATGSNAFKAHLTGKTKTEGNIATPWRIVEIGADLNTLVNCDIVHNVSPPMDKKLFPKGYKTDWIRPGKSVWSWLAGNGDVTFENMKRFSKWAGELGFAYNLVDEGWSRWNDGGKDKWALLKELVQYSDSQHVKVWVWKAYPDRNGVPGLKDATARRAFFKQCKDIGIAGLKIDFFDEESQEVIEFYQAALKDAAAMHLMLDFHGANKPTGESRTWPNEMSREGIRGLENGTDWPGHNTTLPFTRYLAGHGDYTPLTFRDIGKGTTLTHQVTTVAAFTSPFMCLAADPQAILNSPAKKMIQAIPEIWDETIILPQSKIGAVAVMARRSGDTWYLCALNGSTATTLTIDAAFLGKGSYQATVMEDDKSSYDKAQFSEQTITAASKITMTMPPGGGYLARISRGASRIAVYPVPAIYSPSAIFALRAGNTVVPVISYTGKYDYAHFSMSAGTPVDIEITALDQSSITAYRISPGKLQLPAVKENNQLRFTISKDEYLIVKINNGKELVIAADAAETDRPAATGKGIFNITQAPYKVTGTDLKQTTAAIQQAIADAAHYRGGQGIVYVPAGVYATGNLLLKSNVALYLEGGAVLRFSGNPADYTASWHKDSQRRDITWWIATEAGASHVKVYGRGTLDGNGKYAVDHFNFGNNILVPVAARHFMLDGLIIRDAGSWAITPLRSADGVFKHFKVFNRFDMGENDGIDILESQRMRVQHAIGIGLDDPFSSKTWDQSTDISRHWPGKPLALEQVVFEDLLSWTYCYGYKIGQGMRQNQSDVTFRNCVVYDAAVGIGIDHKYGVGALSKVTFDGIDIEKLSYTNAGHRTWAAFFMENADGSGSGPISQLTVKNINISDKGTTPAKLKGWSDSRMISGVLFDHIRMPEQTLPAANLFGMNIMDKAFYKGITILPNQIPEPVTALK